MGCMDNEGGRELIGAWGELANVRISEWAVRTMEEEES